MNSVRQLKINAKKTLFGKLKQQGMAFEMSLPGAHF
jgi:hypothetical protein